MCEVEGMAHKRVVHYDVCDDETELMDEDYLLSEWDPMAEEFYNSENTDCGLEVPLYVADIPDHINNYGLRNIFGKFGNVMGVRILPKRANFKSSRGFVNYATKRDAVRAIQHLHRQPPFFLNVKFKRHEVAEYSLVPLSNFTTNDCRKSYAESSTSKYQRANTEKPDLINIHVRCDGREDERIVTLAKPVNDRPLLSERPEFQNHTTKKSEGRWYICRTVPIRDADEHGLPVTFQQSLTCLGCKKPSGWCCCKPTQDRQMQKRLPSEFPQPSRQPLGRGFSAYNQSHFEQNRSESSHIAAPVVNFNWSNDTPSFTAKHDNKSFFTKKELSAGANNRFDPSGKKARQPDIRPKSLGPKTSIRSEPAETSQRSFGRGYNRMNNDGANGHCSRNGEPSKMNMSGQRNGNKRVREDSRESEFKGVTASSHGYEADNETKDNESPQGASESSTPTVVSRGSSPVFNTDEVFQKRDTASATEREKSPLKLQSGERKFEASPNKQLGERKHQLSQSPIKQPSHETSPYKRQFDDMKRERVALNKTNDASCRERLEKPIPKNNAPSGVAGNIEETFGPELSCPELKLTMEECRNQSISVMISHIEKPDIFWCQLIDKMTGDVNVACQSENNFIPKLGCVYAVKFEGDMQWYRGRITQVNENGTYVIHYVDFGNSDEVTREKIKLLMAPCLKPVAQALKCKMSQVLKSRFSNLDAFSSAMLGSQKILVVQRIVHDILIADLLDEVPESDSRSGNNSAINDPKPSQRQSLPKKQIIEESKSSEKTSVSCIKPLDVTGNRSQFVGEKCDFTTRTIVDEIKQNDVLKLLVSYVFTCFEFSVTILSKKYADYLTNFASGYVDEEEDPQSKFTSDVERGDFVAAKSDCYYNTWYRAMVLGRSTAEDLKVAYIDYGNDEVIKTIKPLKSEHTQMPPLAIRFTVDQNQEELKSYLEENVLADRQIEMRVLEAGNGKILGEIEFGGGFPAVIVNGVAYSKTMLLQPRAPKHPPPVGRNVALNNIEVRAVRSSSRTKSPVKPTSMPESPVKPTRMQESPVKPTRMQESPVKPTIVPKSPARAVKTIADLPQPLPLSENIVQAMITHMENNMVYLQLENTFKLLQEVADSLLVCFESGDQVYLPAVGELVCAISVLDDVWYRAEVSNITADKVEVFFIDYGNSEILDTTRLRAIPDAAVKIPQCSVCATLKPVPPSLEELVSLGVASVKIVKTDGGLCAEFYENGEPMFPSGAASRVESEEFEEVNYLMDKMKPSVLPLGESIVKFTHINNRSMMFCLLQDCKTFETLKTIQELVDKFINTHPKTCVPEIGDMLIVYSDDMKKWCRATCLGFESDQAHCFLVDYGNICWISSNNCHPFTSALTKYPMMAIHCALKDDVPDDKLDEVTSLASIPITVLENDDTVHIVTL